MAEVFTARHPHGSMDISANQDVRSRAAPLVPQTSGLPLPEPNPPYVFPGFKDPATMQDTYATLAETSDTTLGSRRPPGRSRPKNLSINALPVFEFGAGSDGSANTRGPSPSPTRSPARRTPPLHHASGHRRGGSEFVGGDVAHPITAGTSPVKSEDSSPQTQKPSGPPVTRRGHAHRRSGALSQHDLSILLKPASDSRGGSAPTTPSELSFNSAQPPHPGMDRSLSQPTATISAGDGTPSPPGQENNQSRTRVTFNNDPEYIPRPLSTISSDTSSSMSTVRANHSVTDSINSLVSAGASSPASTRIARFGSGSFDGDSARHRSRSSGSVSQFAPQGLISSSSHGVEPRSRPSSAPMDKTKDQEPKHLAAFLGSKEGSATSHYDVEINTLQPPGHVAFDSSLSRPATVRDNRAQQFPVPSSPVTRPRTSPEPKVVKRQKKVKSWAGSILSRKAKQQMIETAPTRRRTPTPPQPHSSLQPNPEFSLDDITFDEDTTCIIETPHSTEIPSSLPTKPSRYPNSLPPWKSNSSNLSYDDDDPILDIDAALGFLDRPSSSSMALDGSGGFTTTKRRMHSRGDMGGFSGPGMHYHRRAESAPELDLDHGRLGFTHRGSNPAMADAIEEEEEDGDDVVQTQEHSEEQEMGLGVNVVESEQAHNAPMRRRTKRTEESPSEPEFSSGLEPEPQQILGEVEIVGADEEPRFSVITKSSDGSTITPTLSPEPLVPISAPVDVAKRPRSVNQASETSSALSSPDLAQISFENQDPPRLHTATSSMTDRATLSSSRTGEHGHGSVDDVPSLTSSASTMISGHPTRFSSGANTTASSAERSSSLSAAVPARTSVRPGSSKRSSLASLSRLVGGSYNKSKLNIAELAPPDSPDKVEKKKGKRMSRLMFWKSREKLS